MAKAVNTKRGTRDDRVPDFRRFIEESVHPIKTQLRLDGREAGGNRSVFGYFRHHGKNWRVNADTRVGPLLSAYSFDGDPFEITETRTGRACLAIKSAIYGGRRKHVYIYESTQA